jgi:hypothetical protein
VDLSNVKLEAPVEIDWGDLEVVDDETTDDVKIDWDAVDVVAEVQVKRDYEKRLVSRINSNLLLKIIL